MNPLAIDLFCGLGGWTEGLLDAGYFVAGFDIERHVYGEHRYPAQLVLQDVRTIHGSQFKDAALIVASPPCQEFSYMAMPWSRAKQIAKALRGQGEFPDGYKGSRTVEELTALFDACFRIQREACEAAGRHVPMVVENVKGAQPWVGRARWSYGSYFLWGDVPALMPATLRRERKNGTDRGSWFPLGNGATVEGNHGRDGVKVAGMNWSGSDKPGYRAVAFNDPRHLDAHSMRWNGASFGETKNETGGSWFAVGHSRVKSNNARDRLILDDSAKQPGIGGTRSNARKAASARIAKIPFALAQHIAHVYRPVVVGGGD